MCYYFDDIIKLGDFDLDNILINQKLHENILIYVISFKTLIDSKPLRIRSNKIDGFIRIYDGTRYSTLFGSEKYEAIYKGLRCFVSLKSGITYIFSLYFAEININSYDSLPIEKILTLHNVTIHIKSVLNKDKNHYYYNTFFEKYYQLAENWLQIFVYGITVVRFGEKEIAKEKFYAAKNPLKILDFNVDNIVISKLVKIS